MRARARLYWAADLSRETIGSVQVASHRVIGLDNRYVMGAGATIPDGICQATVIVVNGVFTGVSFETIRWTRQLSRDAVTINSSAQAGGGGVNTRDITMSIPNAMIPSTIDIIRCFRQRRPRAFRPTMKMTMRSHITIRVFRGVISHYLRSLHASSRSTPIGLLPGRFMG